MRIIPGVDVVAREEGVRVIETAQSNVVGLVGAFQRGRGGEAVLIDNFLQAQDVFGEFGYAGMAALWWIYKQAKVPVRVVRILGTGAVASTITAQDRESTTPVDTVTFTAINEGAWGDDLSVVVSDNDATGYVDVEVQYKGSAVEEFRKLNMDSTGDNYLVNAINRQSAWIQATDESSGTTAPDNNPAVDTYELTGGADGSISDSDYTTALQQFDLEENKVNVVVADKQSEDVSGDLIDHAVAHKDRIAVVTDAEDSDATAAVTTANGLTRSQFVVFAFNWIEDTDPKTGLKDYYNPTWAYAGRLAGIDPHVSPSYQQIMGVTSTKYKLTVTQLETLQKAGISPITLIRGKGYRIRNGVTMSADQFWAQTNIVRETAKIVDSLREGLFFAISKPHTAALRHDVRMSINRFLDTEVGLGALQGYTSKCDEDNNPLATQEAGELHADVTVQYTFAADKILVDIYRAQESLTVAAAAAA